MAPKSFLRPLVEAPEVNNCSDAEVECLLDMFSYLMIELEGTKLPKVQFDLKDFLGTDLDNIDAFRATMERPNSAAQWIGIFVTENKSLKVHGSLVPNPTLSGRKDNKEIEYLDIVDGENDADICTEEQWDVILTIFNKGVFSLEAALARKAWFRLADFDIALQMGLGRFDMVLQCDEAKGKGKWTATFFDGKKTMSVHALLKTENEQEA